MPKLFCAVVGEGRPFSVEIAAEETVDDLKDKIKDKNHYKFPADELQLYCVDGLAQDEDEQILYNGTTIDMPKCSLDDFGGSTKKLATAYPLSTYPTLNDSSVGRIHVLVVPEGAVRAAKKGKWSAEELSTVDPQVLLNIWKSVVRFIVSMSSCVERSGTALVVDRTLTHLYLLTNLHLWVDEEFTDGLSDDFKKEIKRYWKLHPGKKSSGKRKDDTSVSGPSIRKSQRTSLKKAQISSDIPQIAIEQLLPDGKTLKEVHKFSLESGICWRSSADFDFAIFEIPISQDVQLVRSEMSIDVFTTMHGHVFGFAAILQDRQFGYPYAIIPAEVTGTYRNQMTLSTLSAPDLSGSGIICTKRGIPVGYIGGGFDGSSKNEQYQSYGFTLQGIPHDCHLHCLSRMKLNRKRKPSTVS